jgi:hypothetical protein
VVSSAVPGGRGSCRAAHCGELSHRCARVALQWVSGSGRLAPSWTIAGKPGTQTGPARRARAHRPRSRARGRPGSAPCCDSDRTRPRGKAGSEAVSPRSGTDPVPFGTFMQGIGAARTGQSWPDLPMSTQAWLRSGADPIATRAPERAGIRVAQPNDANNSLGPKKRLPDRSAARAVARSSALLRRRGGADAEDPRRSCAQARCAAQGRRRRQALFGRRALQRQEHQARVHLPAGLARRMIRRARQFWQDRRALAGHVDRLDERHVPADVHLRQHAAAAQSGDAHPSRSGLNRSLRDQRRAALGGSRNRTRSQYDDGPLLPRWIDLCAAIV